MTDETMPDWVLIEAGKQCGMQGNAKSLRIGYNQIASRAFRALCDNILKHEQPPVDRKLLCAREAMSEALDGPERTNYRDGKKDAQWTVRTAIRAIELYEEGLGK